MEDYFFDVRKYQPQEGQVLAKFTAMADFVDGQMKRDVIYLLREARDAAEDARTILESHAGAPREESLRVLQQMTADLLNGMSPQEVEEKPYVYRCEFFFYVEPQHVPTDNPHWSIMDIISLNNNYERNGRIPELGGFVGEGGGEVP